jgi:hypothetical protein
MGETDRNSAALTSTPEMIPSAIEPAVPVVTPNVELRGLRRF